VTVTLLRHYKVIHSRQRKYTPAGYLIALREYDEAEVLNQYITLPNEYQRIITSTMKRTQQTFAFIYGRRKHEETALLNEVPMMPFTKRNREYDATFLDVTARVQWMFNNRNQPETRKLTITRAREFIDQYLQDGNSCLIIGHGFFLRTLAKQMLKNGFKGKEIMYIRNGEYHTYTTE
jgi:broad specificity phosphatase PhoE